MTSPAYPIRKPRRWIWLLGGIAGFLALNGWMPFFLDGWWYGTFRDAYVGNPIESVEAVFFWLFLGPIEGFLIGFLVVRWLDKRFIKASDSGG